MAGVETETVVALRSHLEPKGVRGLASFLFVGPAASFLLRVGRLASPAQPLACLRGRLPRETHRLPLANTIYMLSIWGES